jgi:Kef-type K+ transport system membrane component KefB
MLPIFFVVVGLNTKLSALSGGMQWLACGLITAVAIATKFLGTGIAARATGSPIRDSVALGVMMNCRGLTELVVLTVGLQLGVLSPALFAMFVIMALLTTAMTGPLLRSTLPAQPVRSENDRKASQHDPALL